MPEKSGIAVCVIFTPGRVSVATVWPRAAVVPANNATSKRTSQGRVVMISPSAGAHANHIGAHSKIRLLGVRLWHRVVVEIVGIVLGADVLEHRAGLPAAKALDRRPGRGEGTRIVDGDQNLHHVAVLDE